MKTINSQNFLIELTIEDINNLELICFAARIKWHRENKKSLADLAENYWRILYQIRHKEGKPF